MKRLQLVIVALFVALGVDAQPTQRIYLSGTDVEHPRTWDFYCSGGQNSGRWSTIEVPSCWELQGYGEYTYGRFYRTKGLKPSTETGRYRTTFKVPRGGHYRLVFEGSMTDTQVWIDGKQVGEVHQGGFTEFSYDVTPYIRPNRVQKLEVLVHKESSNDSVNEAERRADWWLFGGIYRPVYIEVLPEEHISHVAIDARANGEIYADVETSSKAPVNLTIDGKTVAYNPEKGC